MVDDRGWIKRLISRDFRSDGRLVRHLEATQQIVPYVMGSRPAAAVYLKETFDITRTLDYIGQNNAQPDKENLSLFTVLLAALLRTGVLHPKLNRFVVGKRIYARNQLQISFTMKQKMTEEGSEMVIKETFHPEDTLKDVAAQVNGVINRARQNPVKSHGLIENMLKLPPFLLTTVFYVEKFLNNWGLLPAGLIKTDPLFSSVFVANLGSLDLQTVFHPLYERGTISLFVVLGKYREEVPLWNMDGQLTYKSMVNVTISIDSRIADGFSISRSLQTLRTLLENPELLEN